MGDVAPPNAESVGAGADWRDQEIKRLQKDVKKKEKKLADHREYIVSACTNFAVQLIGLCACFTAICFAACSLQSP